jgi:transposase-like protein
LRQVAFTVFLKLARCQELIGERGLSVAHTSIWRWTQVYGPKVYRRLQGAVKQKSSTWHLDETFVRISGRWMYLFRAVDSAGQTVDFYLSGTRDREAAKQFLKRSLANGDNRPPRVFARDGRAAIQRRFESYKRKVACTTAADSVRGGIVTTRTESDHRAVKRRRRAMQGPRTRATAWAAIQAAQMIRKGQVLGITRQNLYGQAWVFVALLQAE